MIPIRVFDQNLNLITECDNYESAWYTRSWYAAGDFSITINLTKQDGFGNYYSAAFARGNFILWNNDPNKLGIITDTEKTTDEKGHISDEVTVTGREAVFLLNRRVVMPPSGSAYLNVSAPVETVLKTLVSSQAGPTVTDTNRQIPLLDIDTNLGLGSTYLLNARYTSVWTEIQNACLASGMGCAIVMNAATKRLTFKTFVGLNRTAGQSSSPPAIFSTNFDSIRSADLKDSDLSFQNFAYVGGQGTGSARTIQPVYPGSSAPTGLNRWETFVDASDLSATADLTTRGASILAQNQFTLFFSGGALARSPLKYQTDYDLGDIVSISQFGSVIAARLTEIKETVKSLEYDLDITFDKAFPEFPRMAMGGLAALQATNNARA